MSAPDNMSTQQSGQAKNAAPPGTGSNAAQTANEKFWARYHQLTHEPTTAPAPATATRAVFDPESFRATTAAVSRLLTMAQEAIARRQFAEAMEYIIHEGIHTAPLFAPGCVEINRLNEHLNLLAMDSVQAEDGWSRCFTEDG